MDAGRFSGDAGRISRKCRTILGALGLVTLLSACDLFDVVNPGPIVDDALNEEAAGKTVLVGVVADVEVAVDNLAWLGGPASTDLDADATQPWLQDAGEGRLTVVNAETSWNPLQLARWGAAAGIARLSETQSDAATNQYLTAAYMWAGWANRVSGDNLCIAVFGGEDRDGDGTPDPGEVMDIGAYHTRAIERFETAISRAAAGGPRFDHRGFDRRHGAGAPAARQLLPGSVAGVADPGRLRVVAPAGPTTRAARSTRSTSSRTRAPSRSRSGACTTTASDPTRIRACPGGT